MQFKKIFLSFIIFSLALPAPLLGQAMQSTNILDVVQAHKPDEFFHFLGAAFALKNAGVTDLTGIERIKGIGNTTVINISGNNLGVIKTNTFNYPVFKNVKILNLSANNLTMIDSGALHGLDSLEVLLIENNNLSYLADGALSGADRLKYIYIADNLEISTLKKQIQKQLPKVKIYTMAANKQRFIKAIAGLTGLIIAVVLFAINYPKIKQQFAQEAQTQLEESVRAGLLRQRALAMAVRPELRKETFFNPETSEETRKNIIIGLIEQHRIEELFDYLHEAVQSPNKEIAQTLISFLPNEAKLSELHAAVQNKNFLLANFLLSQGVNPTELYEGKTALGIAQESGDQAMINLLQTPRH